MANGAVAANGPSKFVEQAFAGGFLSVSHDAAAAAAAIEAALVDKAALRNVAATGHAAVVADHLWCHRARAILALAGG
jgi:glycosyl transferase family 1